MISTKDYTRLIELFGSDSAFNLSSFSLSSIEDAMDEALEALRVAREHGERLTAELEEKTARIQELERERDAFRSTQADPISRCEPPAESEPDHNVHDYAKNLERRLYLVAASLAKMDDEIQAIRARYAGEVNGLDALVEETNCAREETIARLRGAVKGIRV